MFSGQLNECYQRLDKFQNELKRHQGYYEEAVKSIQTGGGTNNGQNNSLTNSPRLTNGGARHHRNSGGSAGEEESLSRSASDTSVTNPTLNHNKQSAPGTPQLNNHGWVLVLPAPSFCSWLNCDKLSFFLPIFALFIHDVTYLYFV